MDLFNSAHLRGQSGSAVNSIRALGIHESKVCSITLWTVSQSPLNILERKTDMYLIVNSSDRLYRWRLI